MGSRSWSAVVVACLVLASLFLGQLPIAGVAGVAGLGEYVQKSPDASGLLPAAQIAGRASCSGRNCHGSLEPGPTGVRQSEFTTWITHDKHARAFDVLSEERGRQIAKNLGIADASRDERCLACHTTPALAGTVPEELVALRSDGVSCEACHGAAKGAEAWLTAHTLAAWKEPKGAARVEAFHKHGMTPLFDLEVQAKTCAGCHVGAPADPAQAIPARNLTHDLMAAGHPRLTFELSAFRDNMPPHWRPDLHAGTPGYEAAVWAVGQAACAQASVDLTADRAKQAKDGKGPWPEFAESSCFACHANLNSPSWRRNPDYYSGRKPGAIPYDRWYYALLPVLDGVAPGKAAAVDKAVQALANEMNKPYPDPAKVLELTGPASKDLGALAAALKSVDYNPAAVKALAEGLSRQAATFKALDWDEATQSALAAAALRAAAGPPAGSGPLDDVFRSLAFPPSYDSPQGYTPGAKAEGEAEDLRARLLKVLEGIAH
jgi:hypothetical protein